LARIVAVADAFDAMTSHRPYHAGKQGRPSEEAFAEVEEQLGRQFDPTCGSAFLEIRDDILRSMRELMPESSLRVPINNLEENRITAAIAPPQPHPEPAPH
jgi:HD-GYP domain-containing protein (c-di-GMP phosphodiesterase class II)